MLTPLHNRVLVEPIKETVTKSGILLPENKERPVTGIVVVGNDEVKKGEKILFSLFGLDEIVLEGKNYALVSKDCVLGIFK